eukprot:m.339615 g.339615  ORF g.339615 m.339615 type:complete len:483 (-) comp18886_c0_seq1:31-1479(-)
MVETRSGHTTSNITNRKTTSSASQNEQKKEDGQGNNWVHGGIDNNPYFFALICFAPLICQLLACFTSDSMKVEPYLSSMIPACLENIPHCGSSVLSAALAAQPTLAAAKFLASFMGVAFLLEFLPGKTETGPETLTGHVPKYVDNGVLHCFVFSALFFAGSNVGIANLYDFGIIFDIFPELVGSLNVFGIVFAAFLCWKGLYFPSTKDCGSSGSLMHDFMWGTELYPRFGWFDLKRFINCRFSMTFWQLAGLSFAYRSYTLHDNTWDWGLVFSAISQYLYLVKFFWWEMGYMRSIDIIVDRAGFEIQWGCLVWVPAVYTLHSRFLVLHPSGFSFSFALGLFVISMAGVVLNYLADAERDYFRAMNGKCKVWGKEPKYIQAYYTVVDPKTGKKSERTSLLLASGFWGVARHFQYLFELIAAWSWCLFTNPLVNGVLPLWYAGFLTYLLIDRANRDSDKCLAKYGKYYESYCKLVPYKILPGVY